MAEISAPKDMKIQSIYPRGNKIQPKETQNVEITYGKFSLGKPINYRLL